MLYSLLGKYPTSLPFRIVLSDGRTRTDPSSFTQEEIADAGYVPVENPPVAEYPNKVEWNGTQWYIREPNNSEISIQKQNIQKECKQRLFETDYKVIKSIETAIEIDPVYVQYRQELRDLYNSVDEIDIWTVEYPRLQFGEEPSANTELGMA
jgi:hypothetical protein